MKIVVCVKHVPDATAERGFDSADNTVDRVGVDGLLSELDENAVEEALRLAEASEGEVTVLTVGPQQAGDAIRKALQMGAHKGVHVSDEAIAGSDVVATSLVIARTLTKIADSDGWDLAVFGMASTDGSMGVVPALVAERLGVPALTQASSVSVEESGVTITRDGDTATETVTASGQLVLSVTDHANEPRYPSFKGIMAAKKKPVESWDLEAIGVEASEVGLDAAWTTVDSFAPRPPRSAGEIVTDEGDGGTKLAEFLASKKFV